MTYAQALKNGKKQGVSKAGTEEYLALVCETLASLHAINPALVYQGARKRELDARQVAKLGVDDPVALGDLMFV